MQVLIIKEIDKDGVWFLAKRKEDNSLIVIKRTLEEVEHYLEEKKEWIINGNTQETIKEVTL